jgi:septal ring factor EnvC (AmiA/AmiB activator)
VKEIADCRLQIFKQICHLQSAIKQREVLMKVRRTPMIFSLSLVDMLCCALGCLVLLWLVNSREALRKGAAADQIAQQLQQTLTLLTDAKSKNSKNLDSLSAAHVEIGRLQDDLDKARGWSQSLQSKLDEKNSTLNALAQRLRDAAEKIERLKKSLQDKDNRLAHLNDEAEALTRQLAGSNLLVRQLTGKLKKSQGGAQELSAQLAASQKESGDLSGKLALSDKQVRDLTGQLRAFDKQVKEMAGQLEASDNLAKKLQDLVAELRVESKDTTAKLAKSQAGSVTLGSKLARSQQDVAMLTKQLTDLLKQKDSLQQALDSSRKDLGTAGKTIEGLKADKTNLLLQKNQVQSALANRFAGINLTGKKVIFLIDISGSMGMLDSKTKAPTKWPQVCTALGKVIRSLPDVSHYQVIVFAEGVWYPMGKVGQWLPFDPKTSPKSMEDALRRIEPKGGTKMRPAFAEAFRFRETGLDTIYLVSDGLPNDDDNLPPEVTKLQEVERTTYLSQQIRQLLKTVWNRPINNQTVRINAIGFYFDSPEVGAFLWALARENNGGFVGMSSP